MLPHPFDFERFAAALTSLDTGIAGIHDSINLELQDADGLLGTAKYCSLLKALRHLIDTGTRLTNFRDDREFLRLRPVIERLVERRLCDASTLKVFQSKETLAQAD